MLTRCGRDIPAEKVALHQARCTACGGKPPQAIGTEHPVDYFSEQEGWDIVLAAPLGHWRLIFWVFHETGFRLGEVLAIRQKDILPSCELGVWTEKQKKPVYEAVPISDDLRDELLRYAIKTKRSRLFPVSKGAVDHRLKRLAVLVGISRPVHSHMFRHGACRRIAHIPAITYAEALTTANRILRHRSLRTTERYFKATNIEAKTAYRKLLEG